MSTLTRRSVFSRFRCTLAVDGLVSHHSEFGAGSCVAIQQAIKHASSGRLADGRRNPGDGYVNVFFAIHTLIVDEVFLSPSWHTAEYASGRALNRGARPPRSHGGRPGDWCGANGWLWRFTGRTGR